MANFELIAKTRQDTGKGASRRLRRLADQVPGIIYGGEQAPVMLSIEHNHLFKSLNNEAFYSHILTIVIDGKAEKAVLKDLQRHPYKPRITHIDLLRVTGKEKITMHVPLHFVGGDKSPGAVKKGGVISHVMSDVEVRCLPDNLPEFITVDITHMDLDDVIHLSQLPIPKGVECVELSHGHDPLVAAIHLPRAAIEEEAEATTVAASEVPVAEKGKEKDESTQADKE